MEMVQGPLMGQVFGKISGLFRESPEGVKRGFESAVPLSMVGLAERASTQEGAQDHPLHAGKDRREDEAHDEDGRRRADQ